jgi:hypothetical protein
MTDTRTSEADLQATQAQPNTSTAGTPNPPRAIVLTDYSDMTLLIGDDKESQQPVLVSKVSMSQASPVWKAMFAQHWVENEATEILLPDDDVDAMLLVLRIAHLRFQEIPPKNGLDMEALLNLAVVCDKYDLVGLVRPFLNLHCWTETLIPDIGLYSKPKWHPFCLFIAWTFGYIHVFDAPARHLALTVSLNSQGVATFGKDELFPEEMPPEILGKHLVSYMNYSRHEKLGYRLRPHRKHTEITQGRDPRYCYSLRRLYQEPHGKPHMPSRGRG